MAEVTLQNELVIHTNGDLPAVGAKLPEFSVLAADLSEISSADFAGKNLVLNIFPSVDTGVCATSVRTFNKQAAGLENTVVLCVSNDLPFAIGRFCAAEGIENVQTSSAFRSSFGEDFGVKLVDGPLAGLHTPGLRPGCFKMVMTAARLFLSRGARHNRYERYTVRIRSHLTHAAGDSVTPRPLEVTGWAGRFLWPSLG